MMMIVLQHGNTALHEAAWKGFSLTLSFLCQVAMLRYLSGANAKYLLNCKYLFSQIFRCIVSIYFSLHPLAGEHIQIPETANIFKEFKYISIQCF